MRKYIVLSLSLLVTSGCEIEAGSFDGSFWEDARVDDDDGGVDEDDAGRPPRAGRGGSGGSAAPELEASDVPAVIARGLCGAAEACIGKSMLLDALEGSDCVEFRTKQEADRHLHWLQDSIDANRVRFRPELLDDCERDLIALGCDAANRRLPDSCEEAVEGLADVDESCAIDQDCAGNAWCDKGEQETCPGTCAAPQTSGLPCRASRHCADGLICEGGSCTPPRAEGDECNSLMGEACPFGLVCHGRANMQTCRSIDSVYVGASGADCDAFGQLCQVGLVCQSQSSTSTAGQCVAPAGLNGTCRLSQPSQCPTSQYCKVPQTNSTSRVAPGEEGVCSDRPGDGVACVVGEECAPGTVCVGEMAMCRTRKSAGSTCVSNAECFGGSCEEDICVITTIGCD